LFFLWESPPKKDAQKKKKKRARSLSLSSFCSKRACDASRTRGGKWAGREFKKKQKRLCAREENNDDDDDAGAFLKKLEREIE